MALAAALKRLIDWFWDSALPIWAERGAAADGLFFESLDFDGHPIENEPRRVRVQARQIHVFATAAALGRHPAAEGLARRGFDYLLDHGCSEEGRRGCVHALAPDGQVLDSRRDLYDQAFLLLASASMHQAFGEPRALDVAGRTFRFLEKELAAPGGGFLEDDRGARPRRQNPHMHLFEALTALGAADPAFRREADEILTLFNTRFLDRRMGIVREFFADDLVSPDRVKGDVLEPGHMAEWVWLLDRYESGSLPVPGTSSHGDGIAETQALLYASARAFGEDAAGFLVDAVRIGDRPAGSRRLWPQTEYLKASLVMMRRGEKSAAGKAERLLDALFATYLDQPVGGLWCDVYDGEGRPAANAVPASILYHLMEAALEAERRLEGART